MNKNKRATKQTCDAFTLIPATNMPKALLRALYRHIGIETRLNQIPFVFSFIDVLNIFICLFNKL